jgi:hypothetical protein
MAWERCGNTPFYFRDGGYYPSGAYVNPINLTHISVGSVGSEGEGGFGILYRRAPGYDLEALKAGVHSHSESEEEARDIRKHTHRWASDLLRAKELNVDPRELRSIFGQVPAEVRDDVLVGVISLLDGYEMNALENIQDLPTHGKYVLVALRGSPSETKVPEAGGYDEVLVVDSVEEGLDRVLERYGILEC